MPRVADYSIISDGWVAGPDNDQIEFTVASNVDPGSRSILGFMLDVKNNDDLTIKVRINGSEVWKMELLRKQRPSGALFPGGRRRRHRQARRDERVQHRHVVGREALRRALRHRDLVAGEHLR